MLVDKIKNIVPEAEIDESGILTVTVEPAKCKIFHAHNHLLSA